MASGNFDPGTQRARLTRDVKHSLQRLAEAGFVLLDEPDGSIDDRNLGYFGGHISAVVSGVSRLLDAIKRLD